MKAIFDDEVDNFVLSDSTESLKNLSERYADIVDVFQKTLSADNFTNGLQTKKISD